MATDPATAFGGYKVTHLLAGFAGGAVGLLISDPMGKLKMLIAVAVGVVTAVSLTPLVADGVRFVVPITQPAENGLGFIIGLTAIHILKGATAHAKRFAENPVSYIKEWKSGTDK